MTNELSPRQKKALKFIGEGRSIDQAAEDMHVSKSTLEKHLKVAKEKLGARNLRNAVYIAAKRGLIILCCVSIYNADDARRTGRVRLRRRDSGELTLMSDEDTI